MEILLELFPSVAAVPVVEAGGFGVRVIVKPWLPFPPLVGFGVDVYKDGDEVEAGWLALGKPELLGVEGGAAGEIALLVVNSWPELACETVCLVVGKFIDPEAWVDLEFEFVWRELKW